jgi:hypothetical protein
MKKMKEGLPSSPLDKGAFFATQPTSIQLSEVPIRLIPILIGFGVELQSNFPFIFNLLSSQPEVL